MSSDFSITSDSFIPAVPSTTLIRPAIEPLLLSAIDVALETTGADFPVENITVTDFIAAMRNLAEWHCIIYDYTQKTQVITIPFDRMLANPEEVENQLAQYLSTSHEPQKKMHVNMEDLAKRAFNRIDQHDAFLSKFVHAKALEDAAKELDREIQSDFCKLDHYHDDKPVSRVAEISGRVLGYNSPNNVRTLCMKYPTARICARYLARHKESQSDDEWSGTLF
jgi:hypothetical protein